MGENPNFKYPYTFLFDKKNNNDGKNDLDGESKYYFDVKNIAAAYYIMPVIFLETKYLCMYIFSGLLFVHSILGIFIVLFQRISKIITFCTYSYILKLIYPYYLVFWSKL